MGWSSLGLSRRLTLLRSEMSSAAIWLAVVSVTVKREKTKVSDFEMLGWDPK